MSNLPVLATKAIGLLKMGAPLETIYPLLRTMSPLCEELYGNHPGPQIRMRRDVYQDRFGDDWFLWTQVPGVDFTNSARWKVSQPLSPDDDKELRDHLIGILKMWLAEDALFAEPMAMQDAVKMLGLKRKTIDAGVKALNRHIKTGDIRAIKLNKNLVRILRDDLPKN